jgi:hypothetical protein
MARAPDGRFPRPAFCQRVDFFGEPAGIYKVRIEVFGKPFFKFGMAFMLWVSDGLKTLGVTAGASDIFWRTASARLDQARIKCARFGMITYRMFRTFRNDGFFIERRSTR